MRQEIIRNECSAAISGNRGTAEKQERLSLPHESRKRKGKNDFVLSKEQAIAVGSAINAQPPGIVSYPDAVAVWLFHVVPRAEGSAQGMSALRQIKRCRIRSPIFNLCYVQVVISQVICVFRFHGKGVKMDNNKTCQWCKSDQMVTGVLEGLSFVPETNKRKFLSKGVLWY